ncbi:Serine protease, partial [Candidatus Methanophagaceae archaeon]
RNVTTDWTASPAGEHRIVAIIDPKDAVPEINETNNVQMNFTLVQGPDLIVSDIKLLNITDGTELNAANISADELVNITANVSNIGVLPVNNFNVSFFINELCIGSATIINLTQNEYTNVSTCWHAVVGNYKIVATADSGNAIAETNESNNKGEIQAKVLGADLTVNISFNTTANRDNVTVTVNATVTNQGVLQTNNFDSFLFFGQYKNEHGYEVIPYFYGADDVYKSIRGVNRSYAGANCICVHVNATWHLENGEKVYWVKEGDIRIYDGKEEVAVPTEPCCIPVMSDTVSVSVLHGEGQGVELLFYPGDITIRNRSLGVDDTFNISLVETAGKGIYTACIDADSEGVVPEHDKQNNQQVKQLKVLPDFWISNISISGNDTELNGKNDGSTLYINTSITNSGLITGVSDVDVFAVHDWVEISPRFELSPQGYPYGYGYVITHPGADALKIQFKSLNITTKNAPSIETRGFVYIRDKAGILVEEWQENRQGPANSSWITGDTAYVYAPTKCGDSTESNVVIDKYQCMNRIANISGLELQAEETKNYTVMWTPANAGPHAIQMVIDPENKAAEMNESNNELNKSFYVVPYEDPAVVNITFDPLPPVPKNVPVNVTAHIFNNGNSTANFSVDLWALKEELYNYETAHPTDDFNESVSTYPEANWTGVQFAEIGLDEGSITRRMKVEDLYKNNKNTSAYFYSFNGENIEVWTKGNRTNIELLPFNSVSYNDRETTEADGGRKVWGCGIDKISHKICLNHTEVSLGPSNSTNVTGILHQMRVGNGSTGYDIYAVVDMDNVLYEQNESNNELVKVLDAKIPDLTVSNITCDGQPKAEIENIGHEKADNVTVRFSRDVYTEDKDYPPYEVENDGFYSILHKDAKVMRVHFEYLYVDEKKNGSLRIGNRTSWVDYKKDRHKGFWSSWVDVDSEIDSITHPVSLILNKGRYKVDRYEYGVDEPQGTAKPYEIGTKVTRLVDVPFTVENEIYNLTVFVDPENMVEESNEGNNEEKKMMGPDLTIEKVTFLNEAGVEREWDKLIINKTHKIKVVVKNTGCVAASDFAVRFYINNSDDNVTIISFPQEDINLAPGMTKEVEFSWEPSKRGWFIAKAEVDPHKKVPELDEKNNIYPLEGKMEVKVGYPGYKAKDGFMHMFKEGEEIHGGVIYNYGTGFSRLSSATTDDFRTTSFGDPVPENADVRLVRLYVYPDNALYTKKIGDYERKMGFLPNKTQLIVYFNGNNPLPHPADPHSDIPDATGFNVTYATYYYDIPVNDYNHSEGARNWATAERRNCGGPRHYQFGIAGMALLIVYEDENAPLTRYWVGEDRDVMMAESNYHPTGLDYDECTRKIKFTGVTEASLANATLKTVLVSYNPHGEDYLYPEAKGRADALYFNGREIPRSTEDEDIGFWEKVSAGDIALTKVHEGWEYVNVFDGINDAAIQSRGTMMGVAHAILKVEYLPDLVPFIPRSVVVGLPMTVDVENKGKSKARNFSVCFSVSGDPEEKMHVKELEGGGRVQLDLPWTPRAVGQMVKLNVSVDCGNAVRELNEDNNNDSQLVAVRDMLPRLRGVGSSASAWKEGSGSGEGTGEGLGAGTTAGAAGKTVTGGKTGKTITGRLMKGTVARTEETGGGGSVRFSLLALLIRLAVVAVAVSLVCVGYWWERRWHKKNKH